MLQNEVKCSLTLLQFGNYFKRDIWACIGNWKRDIWACIFWNSRMSFSAYKPRSHVFNMTAPCPNASFQTSRVGRPAGVLYIADLLNNLYLFYCARKPLFTHRPQQCVNNYFGPQQCVNSYFRPQPAMLWAKIVIYTLLWTMCE